jgi:hypothetical protein
MESQLTIENKIIRALFLAVALCTWVYVALRAGFMSITHDEVLTWQCIVGNADWVNSPNNHWLNTKLASIPDNISHHHTPPFWLRLPNVLAFGLYAFFWYRLVSFMNGFRVMLLVALPLMFANPIVIDFFSLCRGYGLAMAFLVGAIYCAWRFVEDRNKLTLALALVMQVLMVYANYSFITNAIVLHLIIAPTLWKELTNWKRLVPVVAIDLLLLPAFKQISYFKKTGQLYAGGDNDVVHDSIRSLVQQVFYEEKFTDQNWYLVYLLGVCLLFLFVLWNHLPTRKAIAAILLLLAIPTLLHALNGTLFGHGRTVIYWCIWWAVAAVMIAGALREKKNWKAYVAAIPFAVLSSFMCIHAYDHFGWRLTREWRYDGNSDLIIDIIQKENPNNESRTLGVFWIFEPSLNYYREKDEVKWLAPITRDSLGGRYDFYYTDVEHLHELPQDSLQLIAEFHNSQTKLFKRLHP